MRRPAALFPIALALGAIILAPRAGAQEQGWRAEGPIEIEKCQTISKSGSYKLVNNFTFTGTTGTCLSITADFVTIDLGGFTISGPARQRLDGIAAEMIRRHAVRNGTTGFRGESWGRRLCRRGIALGVAFSSLWDSRHGDREGHTWLE
jgi:hypothetical protein